MCLSSLSSGSWQKWILLLLLLGLAALWISPVSASIDYADRELGAKYWFERGNYYLNLLDRNDAALSCYYKAIEIDPNYTDAWNNIGYALNQNGRYKDALPSLDKATELDPNYKMAWYNKVDSLKRLGRFDEALKVYDIIIKLDSKSGAEWNQKGVTLESLGRYDEAYTAYNKANQLEPHNKNYIENINTLVKILDARNAAVVTTLPTPTQVPTTVVRSVPTNNGSSDAPSPIIPILILLLLAGGGYALYRNEKHLNKENPQPLYYQEHGDLVSPDNLPNRIASVEQKASMLSYFRNPVQALIIKSREQYLYGAYADAQTTINAAEDTIYPMMHYETLLAQWKDEGFITTSLESLNTDNINTINTAFRDFEQNLATVKQHERRVLELKRACSTENIDPSISQRIASVELLLHDPRNISRIYGEIAWIEQEIWDQQERSRQQKETGQLLAHLQSKAEKLTRYASLTDDPLAEALAQIAAGRYDDARKTLRRTEDLIEALLECESSLATWKAQAYTIITLEGLHSHTADEVIAVFQKYRHNINRLETIAQELESKKSTYTDLSGQPETIDNIRTIEQNLKIPEKIETVENAYLQVNNAISEMEFQWRKIEQNLRDQVEKVQRETGSPAIKREIDPIIKSIRQHDYPRYQRLLEDLAGKQLSRVNATLSTLRTDGAVFSLSSDPIREQIAAEHYCDAIFDSEQAIAELTRVLVKYTKAKDLRSTITEPTICVLFENGKYDEFIHASEEQLMLTKKVIDLKEKGRKLLGETEKFGQVPDYLRLKLDANDIPTIESATEELETFSITAKPELTLSLDSTQLSAEKWHKLGITLKNTGLAHVENVTFAFSSEFETKGINPIFVKAGESSRMDIRILPKNAGNILLDVTLTYKDHKGTEYRTVQEIPVDVVEKGTAIFSSFETPASPVSQFTPKPLTPKQLPPDLSDKYTESEFIGKGGFARVFKAKRNDGKFVAVKIPISMDATTGRSFITEMQNWTKLTHPNIVGLYDFNIMPMPYFEEELCDSALSELKKPLETEEAALILFNICEGLKFAHRQKIIHRDLKPQNILLKNGVPKISDWGLSRIISSSTTTTATSFTAYYAAPEQIGNKIKDERTDIWQLGVILYELVSGLLPFTGDSMLEVITSIATESPTQPSVINPSSLDIEPIIMKCLEKKPDKRYQSVLDLQKDLALYLRVTYTELLKTRVSVQDYTRSAYYCGDLVMVNLFTGDMKSAYKYILDLVHYSKGDVKVEAQELSEQIKNRMELGVTEIPDELIQKAEVIVHQVSVGFRNRG